VELGEKVSVAVTTMVCPGTVITTGVAEAEADAESDESKTSVSIAAEESDPSGASRMSSVTVVEPRLISSVQVYGATMFVMVVYAV
jgi:hypothetical protein